MTIACIQTNPKRGDARANIEDALHLLRQVDADLVVLPELFSSGYFFESTSQAHDLAEDPVTGPASIALQSWARETGSSVVAGILERSGDDLYNSAIVVTPKGVLGTYRKNHLYYEEGLHFEQGDGFEVWTVTDRKGGSYRLGVMVCFDWFFPESARTLADRGADVIAHPSNLVMPHCPSAMPIRALENGVFTATANRIGSESKGAETLTFIGQSIICSPSADVLAKAPGDDVAVIEAEIDVARARETKLNAYNDRRTDRRPDIYSAR
ncbi:nitrilase-related carbon-nitrogen hydrolase [Rubrivirga sp.]|uniref:nitrilase-related carbon-nitrogen hydrolase n=1 Tax=Rubrivirga sp. TaxID=1885344 RepID=UPI003C77FD82